MWTCLETLLVVKHCDPLTLLLALLALPVIKAHRATVYVRMFADAVWKNTFAIVLTKFSNVVTYLNLLLQMRRAHVGDHGLGTLLTAAAVHLWVLHRLLHDDTTVPLSKATPAKISPRSGSTMKHAAISMAPEIRRRVTLFRLRRLRRRLRLARRTAWRRSWPPLEFTLRFSTCTSALHGQQCSWPKQPADCCTNS